METPGAGKACYAVLFCTSASGEFLPPSIFYKAQNLYQKWTVDLQEQLMHAHQEDGCMIIPLKTGLLIPFFPM